MKPYAPIPERAENAARLVVEAAYQVHSELGPGLLESVYEVCLCHEIRKQGVQFMNQVSVPVVYDGIRLDAALRLDVLVDNCLVVELKAVEAMIPLYTAQLLTYLKLTGHRLGLLINFNVPVIKEGIRRVVL
ncbi:MAG TPA: GxxExxY protein [bacterium]|nr:GxxExxY protein [bacterium]